jgi:hypothetical protein
MTFGTDIFKNIMRIYERRLEPEYLRVLAEGYWRALLVFALCVFVCMILFGLWQFVTVLDDLSGAQNGTSAKPPVALNRTLLENTLSVFDTRELNYSGQGSGTTFKDPSK